MTLELEVNLWEALHVAQVILRVAEVLVLGLLAGALISLLRFARDLRLAAQVRPRKVQAVKPRPLPQPNASGLAAKPLA